MIENSSKPNETTQEIENLSRVCQKLIQEILGNATYQYQKKEALQLRQQQRLLETFTQTITNPEKLKESFGELYDNTTKLYHRFTNQIAKKYYNKSIPDLSIPKTDEYLNAQKNNMKPNEDLSNAEGFSMLHQGLATLGKSLKGLPRAIQSSTSMFLQLPEFGKVPGDIDASLHHEHFWTAMQQLQTQNQEDLIKVQLKDSGFINGKQETYLDEQATQQLFKSPETIQKFIQYEKAGRSRSQEEKDKKIRTDEQTNIYDTLDPKYQNLIDKVEKGRIKWDFFIKDPSSGKAINVELFSESKGDGTLQPSGVDKDGNVTSHVFGNAFENKEIMEGVTVPAMSLEQLKDFYGMILMYEVGVDRIDLSDTKVKGPTRFRNIFQHLKSVGVTMDNMIQHLDQVAAKYSKTFEGKGFEDLPIDQQPYPFKAIQMYKGKYNLSEPEKALDKNITDTLERKYQEIKEGNNDERNEPFWQTDLPKMVRHARYSNSNAFILINDLTKHLKENPNTKRWDPSTQTSNHNGFQTSFVDQVNTFIKNNNGKAGKLLSIISLLQIQQQLPIRHKYGDTQQVGEYIDAVLKNNKEQAANAFHELLPNLIISNNTTNTHATRDILIQYIRKVQAKQKERKTISNTQKPTQKYNFESFDLFTKEFKITLKEIFNSLTNNTGGTETTQPRLPDKISTTIQKSTSKTLQYDTTTYTEYFVKELLDNHNGGLRAPIITTYKKTLLEFSNKVQNNEHLTKVEKSYILKTTLQGIYQSYIDHLTNHFLVDKTFLFSQQQILEGYFDTRNEHDFLQGLHSGTKT